MEALAKQIGLNPEDAHTLGILHALGRVLINRVIEEKGFAIFWDGKGPVEEWERGAVGFDFAEAGALLMEQWQFAAPTCSAIRWQLHSEQVTEPLSLLGALQFTRRLLAQTGSRFENQNWQISENDPFMPASGLNAELMLQLVARCKADFKRILQTMDLEV